MPESQSITDNSIGLMTSHPMYHTWKGMYARCCRPSDPSFKRYGARGITMPTRWKPMMSRSPENPKIFWAFLAEIESSIGSKPSPIHSLDRIDNSKGYEIGNLKWSTPTEQARNRRNNALLEVNGVTKCISEWAADTGLPRVTIEKRLERGWPPSMAVKEKISGQYLDGNKHLIEYQGQVKCISGWSKHYSISFPTLQARLRYGWSIHDALTKPVKTKRKTA